MAGFFDPLCNPKDANLDIVFVHGLHGDRVDTWTKYGIFWPRDLLPDDVRQARVLSWGYSADIAHFWQKTTNTELNDHAKNLCSDLSGLREQSVDRPIIFVVHSLGGLALVFSDRSADQHLKNIADCTRGIIFLGTPHEGSDKAKWVKRGQAFASLIGRDVNKEVHDILSEGSSRLSELDSTFMNFLRSRRESKDLKTASIEVIVSKASASITGYETQSIPADHRDMCKFASKDEDGYQRISRVLKRWAVMLQSPQPPEQRLVSVWPSFYSRYNHTQGQL
ncbi:hypothetical protein McanCB56680_005469 [Microsporum canis]